MVETTNLNEKSYAGYPGIRPETLRLVERFSLVGPNRMEVTVSYDDATMWMRPWSWVTRLTRDESQRVFEYGCHEGNMSLRYMLSAARTSEK